MPLHGNHLIGFQRAREAEPSLRALDPSTGRELSPSYSEATAGEIDEAVRLAEGAFLPYSRIGAEVRAAFLDAIAEAILALGQELLDRAAAETALPAPRLAGERGRTVGQLGMFAELIREGSWVEARIDRPLSDRKPIPRPDLRRMLVPLGPVAVFGASNFPLAFSVAGGDTASALAAGCPVVVKAHPAHPGTSELVGAAIVRAARETGMPEGVFSLVHGVSHRVGRELASHPLIRAVAFTGSLAGGRALFDVAADRPEPIPVYAEMGSSNPVFVLPGALAARGQAIAQGLAASVTLGSGQFCTNPGMTVLLEGPDRAPFVEKAAELLASAPGCIMVHPSIKTAYDASLQEVLAISRVEARTGAEKGGEGPAIAAAVLLETDAETFAANPRLGHEIYGPSTVAVTCASRDELLDLARGLHGHLTATIHGDEDDLTDWSDLIEILRGKAGRLVFNGFPTGVEVSPAMQHGGPYPSTTDSRSTSVGTAAIERFARPVCFQDFPPDVLPAELQDRNPRGISRLVDGSLTREGL